MSTFIFIVGAFTYFVFGVLAICAALSATAAAWKWATEKHDNIVWRAARDTFVSRLIKNSWWFSEDEKTMRALQIYAEMESSGHIDISNAREKWRNEFKHTTERGDMPEGGE